jgi:hypothetical protein
MIVIAVATRNVFPTLVYVTFASRRILMTVVMVGRSIKLGFRHLIDIFLIKVVKYMFMMTFNCFILYNKE